MRSRKINRPVVRVVSVYLVFGLLWIFFSDFVLLYLASDQAQFARLSTYKGWAYIVITAALLYVLISSTLKQQTQIKHALLISEERWKFALEGAGDGVWDWNLVTDEVFRSGRWHGCRRAKRSGTSARPSRSWSAHRRAWRRPLLRM